jgi:acyl-coenzyme A synthetase/AMP-(fatty) acid ligase
MIASVAVMIATSLIGARLVIYSPRDELSDDDTIILYSPDQAKPVDGRATLIPANWSPRYTKIPNDADLGFLGYRDPEDTWWTIHTSGTTGRPKALGLSHRVAYDRSIAVNGDFRGADTRFCSMFPCNVRPFLVRAMAALSNGSTIVDTMDPAFMDAEGVNLISASPRQVLGWLEDYNPKMRFPKLQVSGAPLRPKAVATLLRTFETVQDVYGSGETNKSFVNQWSMQGGTAVVAGVPQDTDVEIVDAKGVPCPTDVVGDVRMRNSYMCDGYVDAPEATARAFRAGWFYPGDLGQWTVRGALQIVGRADQVINLGGTKVDPLEVEDVLLCVPNVIEAAVFLDPIEQSPPRTMAFLRVASGCDLADTVKTAVTLCEKQLGGAKAPGYVFVVPEIPMTNDGVPRREDCARMAKSLPRQ